MPAGELPFYAPEPTADPRRFRLRVVDAVQVGPPERQFLMGGVSLAAALVALEQVTGRPVQWATAQYLSFAPPGSEVELEVEVPVSGRSVTQGRVTSREGSREITSVSAALGERPDPHRKQFVAMPSVPPPEECPPYEERHLDLGNLHAGIERRRVVDDATDHEGHGRTWFRRRKPTDVTAGLLAVFADFLPGTTDTTHGSSSLDNTLRIHSLKPTEWCLLDARIHGVAHGFFHGEGHLFAQDGTLLATASQTGALARGAPRPA
ncbi:MAG: thioesterase family protein [Myxococcota bacterium]|nr:thioesterase family protein [Myxococcota bacterium]